MFHTEPKNSYVSKCLILWDLFDNKDIYKVGPSGFFAGQSCERRILHADKKIINSPILVHVQRGGNVVHHSDTHALLRSSDECNNRVFIVFAASNFQSKHLVIANVL